MATVIPVHDISNATARNPAATMDPVAGVVFIRRVTAYNLDVEMKTIRYLLDYFPYITIRADYVDFVSARRRGVRRRGRRGRAKKASEQKLPLPAEREGEVRLQPAERYKLAKARVDELDVLQLGITLCNHNGRLPVIYAPDGSVVESAWMVGFSDFDLGSHQKLPAVATLRAAGVNFEGLRARGVPAAAFSRALFEHGIVTAENRGHLTWVAFGGLYDFGFLLKLLSGGEPLPETGEEFALSLRSYLGNVYDAKYLAARLPIDRVDLSGGLARVARLLGAPAVEVQEPLQAGEKSLVACEVFMRMTGLFFAYHDVAVHVGKIDGLQ